MRGTRGRHETKSSARLIIATIFREKLFLSTKFFAQFILCIHYTLLNSIWRDKPQYRMQGWATSGGGESGRRHRDPLPSPSSPGHSHSLRAQESVIEDGQTGERRAVVTYNTRQWAKVAVIVVKLQETGWIQLGQSKAVYYFGKTENIIFFCFKF